MSEKHTEIPCGPYCYEVDSIDQSTGHIKINLCPHWHRDRDKPEQLNGYCSYLDMADWDEESGLSLLWDMIKECGINEE